MTKKNVADLPIVFQGLNKRGDPTVEGRAWRGLTLETWHEMTMSRPVLDSSPSGGPSVNQEKGARLKDLKDPWMFPEGPNVGSGVPPKQASMPAMLGMSKGTEESGLNTSAKPSKEMHVQTRFSKELIDRNSKRYAYSPEGKLRLNVYSHPVMPTEEQNASMTSNESFLDYHSAKDECESLLKAQSKESSVRMSLSPWGKLLSMCRKMKESPIPKLYSKKNAQEPQKEDGQCIQLVVYRCNEKNPMIFSHFRTTDSVGFVETEIKKMLDVHHDVRLWKKGLNDEASLLQRSDSTLKDAGIIHEQVLFLEEKGVHGSKSCY